LLLSSSGHIVARSPWLPKDWTLLIVERIRLTSNRGGCRVKHLLIVLLRGAGSDTPKPTHPAC
jgi:hypothetical protein